eukprot:CAMPEP_0175329836 /NCGR_PEP_ID=MMETSP0095-20121207/410_1 /TAXON_ID=311494 /ORGANISM="Alexandrium monilatum, Strain CCMP3105" /LENGTH=43 /DNA_ID= /DNA_START= /DNA_END= /DNA_ORIENTATION=
MHAAEHRGVTQCPQLGRQQMQAVPPATFSLAQPSLQSPLACAP